MFLTLRENFDWKQLDNTTHARRWNQYNTSTNNVMQKYRHSDNQQRWPYNQWGSGMENDEYNIEITWEEDIKEYNWQFTGVEENNNIINGQFTAVEENNNIQNNHEEST